MFYRIIKHYKDNLPEYINLSIVAVFILIFVEIVAFRYNPYDDNNIYKNSLLDTTVLTMNSCNIKSNNHYLQDISEILKGEKYITIYSEKENKKYVRECIVSNWNIFHLLSHFILCILFPKCWIIILLSSSLYELYEYIVYKAHDYGDIFYNVFGIILGLSFRKLFIKV